MHTLITPLTAPSHSTVSSSGAFFTFYLILVANAICFSSIFRVVAHAAPDGVSSNAYGSLMLLLLLVMSGFAILRSESHPQDRLWLPSLT